MKYKQMNQNLNQTLSFGWRQCEIGCVGHKHNSLFVESLSKLTADRLLNWVNHQRLHSDYHGWGNTHKCEPKCLSLSVILLFLLQKLETVLRPEPPGPVWTHSRRVYVSSRHVASFHIPKDCIVAFCLWRGSCCSTLSCCSCSSLAAAAQKAAVLLRSCLRFSGCF